MATILSTVGICLILISTIYCIGFGYNNSLTCNCKTEDSCQDSGMCTYGGCKPGWSGPTCQKQNVALHKPANQSSYYKVEWLSSRGVDGNKSSFIDMIRSKQGWWLVDLLQNYPITEITLYNRPGYLYRLRGFSVYIIDEDLVSTLCYHHTNETLTDEYKIRCSSTGRYINITSAINPEYPHDREPHAILNLSEVEIYVCSVGTYGQICADCCHCSQYTRCDDITGYCKGGCLPGWHGNSCNQMCSQGNYGERCQQLCSYRNCKTSDSSCHHVTGTCVGGCKVGWTSDDCTLECETGFYGAGCVYKCSERKCLNVTSSSCSHITGECDKGCEEGYTGVNCIVLELSNKQKDETVASSSLHPVVSGVLGAVCGVVVTLAVGIIIYCIYFKRRRKREEVVPDNVIYVNVDVDTETIENGNSNTREPVIISQATVSENHTVQPPNEYETLDQSLVHSPAYTSLQ